ncbi:hypothetical protein SLEP1_g19171 [Rubroshorea leprosula]|nr:hypothetical protein SLEP1_g19171 [Rubroshorea leprosula]
MLHHCCAIAPPLLCHYSATNAPLLRHGCYCTTAAVVAQSRSGSVYLDILVGNGDPRSAQGMGTGQNLPPVKNLREDPRPNHSRGWGQGQGQGQGGTPWPRGASLTSLGRMPPSPRLNSFKK